MPENDSEAGHSDFEAGSEAGPSDSEADPSRGSASPEAGGQRPEAGPFGGSEEEEEEDWMRRARPKLKKAPPQLKGCALVLHPSVNLCTSNSFKRTDRVVIIDLYYTS